MLKRTACLMVILALAACAMPETRIYTLNLAADNSPRTVARDATVLLITNSPKHLAQPYIACRTSPYQLVISRYAKWEASPEAMVRDGFRDSLSATLFREARPASFARSGSYALKIDLKHFERLDEGETSFADVAFDVALLSPEGKDLYRDSISKRVKLDDKTFLSLAKGASSAFDEGAREVRIAIARAMKQ
ncbi:MAG: ABC-type transport auxiliary lipoprotein family protein [Nitrospirota bacterium]|nr:ABC-type transport auxiliary lipoprotein family protein [Nitrospirota bacterium]